MMRSTRDLASKIDKQLVRLNITETNNPIKNWAEALNRHLSKKKRQTDGQEVHEKMFNITNHYRNASQNYSELLPHTILQALAEAVCGLSAEGLLAYQGVKSLQRMNENTHTMPSPCLGTLAQNHMLCIHSPPKCQVLKPYQLSLTFLYLLYFHFFPDQPLRSNPPREL